MNKAQIVFNKLAKSLMQHTLNLGDNITNIGKNVPGNTKKIVKGLAIPAATTGVLGTLGAHEVHLKKTLSPGEYKKHKKRVLMGTAVGVGMAAGDLVGEMAMRKYAEDHKQTLRG
jgi:hypothetical protein